MEHTPGSHVPDICRLSPGDGIVWKGGDTCEGL